ncbi:MAG TPA: hypothetical protein EYO59_03235 [Chromatiaceae bacterium]|nr:hypothetical protein [Chromatiaceae bacterium]
MSIFILKKWKLQLDLPGSLLRALVLASFYVSPDLHATVVIIEDNRSVNWGWYDWNSDNPDGGVRGGGTDIPSAGTSQWISAPSPYSGTLQDSTISTNSMAGTGTAFIFEIPEGRVGFDTYNDSTFDVTFFVDTLTDIELIGSLWMSSDGYYPRMSADVTLYAGNQILDSTILFQRGDTFIGGDVTVITEPIDFLYQDSLATGTYRLVIDAGSTRNNGIGDTHWDFVANYSPTIVPLPASIWFFGSTLLGLACFTRKNKAHK